jgi:hypothetical protein
MDDQLIAKEKEIFDVVMTTQTNELKMIMGKKQTGQI